LARADSTRGLAAPQEVQAIMASTLGGTLVCTPHGEASGNFVTFRDHLFQRAVLHAIRFAIRIFAAPALYSSANG
jgi:hypothetical protein